MYSLSTQAKGCEYIHYIILVKARDLDYYILYTVHVCGIVNHPLSLSIYVSLSLSGLKHVQIWYAQSERGTGGRDGREGREGGTGGRGGREGRDGGEGGTGGTGGRGGREGREGGEGGRGGMEGREGREGGEGGEGGRGGREEERTTHK